MVAQIIHTTQTAEPDSGQGISRNAWNEAHDFSGLVGTVGGFAALDSGLLIPSAYLGSRAIPATIFDVKGDLIAATAADTASRLAVGTNNLVLLAASGETTGLKWGYPNLAGSPDIPAGGASDDEFDTTDTSDPMTGWTTLGTPTAHNINSTVLSHYYVKRNAAAGQNWAGIYKAVPGLPDTVTCKLVGIRSDIAGQAAGVFIGEATPGKLEVLLIQATHQPVINAYTNPTTYASTPYAGTNLSFPVPLYLKIVAASSTDVSYYISRDGYIWTTLVLNRNPGFTIGSMGIAVNPGQATYDGEATFDWIRYS